MTKRVPTGGQAEIRGEPPPITIVEPRRPLAPPPPSRARPPAPSWLVIDRPLVVRRLVRAVEQAPLTLVRAPAGWGKTLAVAGWAARCAEAGRPVGWMSLTERDDDPAVFWAHLHEALDLAGASTVRADRRAGRPDAEHVDVLSARLLELGTPAVIVLDAAERLRSPAVWGHLRSLLDGAGERLRLVVVSRTEPALPVQRYRVEDRMTELGADELALGHEEVGQVLRRHRVAPAEDVVAQVLRRTEGWAAGVRLAALRLAAEGPDADLEGFAAAYLREEVLTALTPVEREVLTETSVADELPPGLAQALTGRPDTDAVLDRASATNAFVSAAPGRPRTYRTHPLVRELLLADLDESGPGRSAALHRRAAAWFDAHGDLAAAVRHEAAGGDWRTAARRVVEGRGLADVIAGTTTGVALAEDLAALPETVSPDAVVLRAAVALVDGDLDRARDRLDRARGMPAVAASVVRTAWYDAAGRWAETLAAARVARSTMADAGSPDPFVTGVVATAEGAAQLRAGDLGAASTALREAVSATTGMDGPLRLRCLAELALAEAGAGRLTRALELVDAAEQETAAQGAPATARPVVLELVRAWVAVERQELAQAGRYLNRVSRARGGRTDETCRTALLLLRARYLRDRGDLRGARLQLRQAGPAPGWLRDCLDAESVGLAEDEQRPVPPAVPGAFRRVEVLLDDADRRSRRGELAGARADVGQALRLASVERLRRPFAHASPTVLSLIRDDARTRAMAGWLGNGDPLGARVNGGPGPTAPVLEPLSERELQVLRHLAAFLTTQEIAAEMFISVNTVRTHVRRVLEKLAVSRRHEAVRRGQELGLV